MPETTETSPESATPRPPGRKKTVDPREVALEALIRQETTGAFPRDVLDDRGGGSAMSDVDRDLARELVRGTLVWRGRIDSVLSRLLNRPLESLSPVARNILRAGVYQLLFLQRIPGYAAVSEAVHLARKREHEGVAGLVNAVLRRVASRGEALLLEDGPLSAGRIAARWSHPLWMVHRWVDRLGLEDAEALCRANNRVPPVILRHNALKGPAEALRERFLADGLRVLPHPLQEGFWVVVEGQGVFRSKTFLDGWVTAQDVSAGLAVLLLDPRPGETVLDLCAAPGGKTGFIAERMGDRGRVLALDRRARRVRDTADTLRRLGLRSVEVRIADALTEDLEQTFDRALVDAPCSGLGVLARRPEVRWRRSASEFRMHFDLQSRLLTRGAAAVRPGGVLVYSTCTTEPEENEEVAEAFLKAHPTFEVEPARRHLQVSPADRYVQTWPHRHDCDGAFAARFRRAD